MHFFKWKCQLPKCAIFVRHKPAYISRRSQSHYLKIKCMGKNIVFRNSSKLLWPTYSRNCDWKSWRMWKSDCFPTRWCSPTPHTFLGLHGFGCTRYIQTGGGGLADAVSWNGLLVNQSWLSLIFWLWGYVKSKIFVAQLFFW